MVELCGAGRPGETPERGGPVAAIEILRGLVGATACRGVEYNLKSHGEPSRPPAPKAARAHFANPMKPAPKPADPLLHALIEETSDLPNVAAAHARARRRSQSLVRAVLGVTAGGFVL